MIIGLSTASLRAPSLLIAPPVIIFYYRIFLMEPFTGFIKSLRLILMEPLEAL